MNVNPWGAAVGAELVALVNGARSAGAAPLSDDDFRNALQFDGAVLLACRTAYYQHLEDLARLPTGAKLLGDVVTQCRTNRLAGDGSPTAVTLISDGGRNRFIFPDVGAGAHTLAGKCRINLQWQHAAGRHGSEDWVLLGRGGGTVRLFGVRVPPVFILAHELGHFWRAAGIPTPYAGPPVLPGFLPPVPTLASACLRASYASVVPVISPDFFDLSAGLPQPAAKQCFLDAWNGNNPADLGKYAEFENILPRAAMDPLPQNPFLLHADGLIIGEAHRLANAGAAENALKERMRPTFFDLENPGDECQVANDPSDQAFVRWGHGTAARWWAVFSALAPAVQGAFMALLEVLPEKIHDTSRAGNPVLTVAQLPQFQAEAPPEPSGCGCAIL